MSGADLTHFMVATYFALRIVIAAGAALLPVVILLWAAIDPAFSLPGSISASYYTPVRNVFVGIIVAVGGALIAYRGYSAGENRLLNLAGVLAVLVAWCPTQNPASSQMNTLNRIHVVAAVSFFLVVALSIVLYARVTLTLLDRAEAIRFSIAYWIITVLMVVLPISAALIANAIGPGDTLFWVETSALATFVAFWVTKTVELRRSRCDERIVGGDVAVSTTGCMRPTY